MNRFLYFLRRLLIAFAVVLSGAATDFPQGGQPAFGQIPAGFPYVALVCDSDTFARSGPGLDYYPTQRLPLNSAVEVYCELPTGWAAIRPPEGSFSWVRGRFIEAQQESGLGKSTSDNVAAAVGSAVGEYRDVIQIRLKKDEPVAIIEKAYAGSEVWYRISPPSGEFRWINLSHLIPADPLRRTAAQNQQLLTANQLPPPPLLSNVEQPLDQIRNEVQYADPFYRRFAQLEKDWQAMLLVNPAQWDVEPLMNQVQNLKFSSQDLTQRKQADLLLDRLTQAREFARYAQAARNEQRAAVPGPNATAFQSAPIANAAGGNAGGRGDGDRGRNDWGNPNGNPNRRAGAGYTFGYKEVNYDQLDQADQLEKRYRLDGVGILATLPPDVVRQTSIRWALKDGQGQIRYYVSPAVGLNFQSMEGQLVGVTGSREYLPRDSRLHITVRNIRPLSEQGRF